MAPFTLGRRAVPVLYRDGERTSDRHTLSVLVPFQPLGPLVSRCFPISAVPVTSRARKHSRCNNKSSWLNTLVPISSTRCVLMSVSYPSACLQHSPGAT